MSDYEVAWLKGTEQISQAAGLTARALRDNPTSIAVSDDPLVRLEMLRSVFSQMLGGARVAGVLRAGCVLGVAAAVRPGSCIETMLPPEVRLLDEPPASASDTERFLYSGSVLATHDLLEPHWHVGPVGVEPGFQGMGLGTAAMKLLCADFDEQDRVAWLETDKPENVRFYMSLGFEVVDEAPMLTARDWFMRRDPR